MAGRPRDLFKSPNLNRRIAGPRTASVPQSSFPPYACDCHAHIFGPAQTFPFAPGRGFTPADTPVEDYLQMLDTIGCARGVLVQSNAHGLDNRALLDAVSRYPGRLRGVAITDRRTCLAELQEWHRIGIRGMRFHLHAAHDTADFSRGVGFEVLKYFTPMLRELGWHAQIWCDWRILSEAEAPLREVAREIPVVIDHMLGVDTALGISHASFQTLLKLLGDGACWVKLSGCYRMSTRYPKYPEVRPFHIALVEANSHQLLWGSDWPHPNIDADAMPNDGDLFDLFSAWTADPIIRQRILVDNPQRLYGFDPLVSDA